MGIDQAPSSQDRTPDRSGRDRLVVALGVELQRIDDPLSIQEAVAEAVWSALDARSVMVSVTTPAGAVEAVAGDQSPEGLGLVVPIPGSIASWGAIHVEPAVAETDAGADAALLADVATLVGASLDRLARQHRMPARRDRIEEAGPLPRTGRYRWDAATNRIEWSDETYRIFGFEPGEVAPDGDLVRDLVHHDDRHRLDELAGELTPHHPSTDAELRIVRPDGTVRDTWNSLVGEFHDDQLVAVHGACLDLTERRLADRRAAEALADLATVERQHQHALDINDWLVQGLATAIVACEHDDQDTALVAIRATLEAAQKMMRDLLGTDTLAAGDFVRARAAAPFLAGADPRHPSQHPGPSLGTLAGEAAVKRVMLVDDSSDMRLVMSMSLAGAPTYEVVAEAGDGAEAIELAADLQPDIVLLDLAMPGMDGLTALPEILRVSPASRVVMLSGFDEPRTQAAAEAAGAAGYVRKGAPGEHLLAVLDGMGAAEPPRPSGGPPAPHSRPDSLASPEATLDFVLHELKTPVAIVQGLLTTLRDRGADLPESTRTQIMETVTRHSELMAGLLHAAAVTHELDAGDLHVARTSTDLVALVAEVVADLHGLLEGHPVTTASPPALEIAIDPLRFRQVLTNLLTNAAKFSEPGRSIELTVRPGAAAAEIVVTDHGCGIPEELQDRLFQRFSRLGHPESGLGLGLYLSRALTEAHGGSLELTETGADGTTFTITLPRSDVPASADVGG